MKIIEAIIPKGRLNRPGTPMKPQYITIHETGNPNKGSNAKAHDLYLKGSDANSAKISWHYTVDDHEAYHHIPDIETAFHAGDGRTGPGNSKSIGIEICVNSDGNFETAKKNAAELVAMLCKQNNIPISNIVQHNKWNGKDCPMTIRKTKTWDAFIANVKNIMIPVAPAPIPAPEHWAKQHLDSLMKAGVIETPESWIDFDNPVTKGLVLALIDKMMKNR